MFSLPRGWPSVDQSTFSNCPGHSSFCNNLTPEHFPESNLMLRCWLVSLKNRKKTHVLINKNKARKSQIKPSCCKSMPKQISERGITE